MSRCDRCGANLALVGRMHNCRPLVANKPEVVANSAPLVANKQSRHGQYADAEKRKTYMRDYMRKRRQA
jgi:hypothetical protein